MVCGRRLQRYSGDVGKNGVKLSTPALVPEIPPAAAFRSSNADAIMMLPVPDRIKGRETFRIKDGWKRFSWPGSRFLITGGLQRSEEVCGNSFAELLSRLGVSPGLMREPWRTPKG